MKCVTLTAETFKNRRDALAVKVLAIQASGEFGSPNPTEMLGGCDGRDIIPAWKSCSGNVQSRLVCETSPIIELG